MYNVLYSLILASLTSACTWITWRSCWTEVYIQKGWGRVWDTNKLSGDAGTASPQNYTVSNTLSPGPLLFWPCYAPIIIPYFWSYSSLPRCLRASRHASTAGPLHWLSLKTHHSSIHLPPAPPPASSLYSNITFLVKPSLALLSNKADRLLLYDPFPFYSIFLLNTYEIKHFIYLVYCLLLPLECGILFSFCSLQWPKYQLIHRRCSRNNCWMNAFKNSLIFFRSHFFYLCKKSWEEEDRNKFILVWWG